MKLTYRSVISVFRFATDIAGKLPSPGDSPLQFLVKLLAIGDSAEKAWGRKGNATALLDLHDVRERNSAAFVKLFWETDLHTHFEIRRFGTDPHLEIVEATAPGGERLFFQEYRYSRVEISADFYHTPGFDFAGAMETLWASYPDGLYLAIESGEYGAREVKFCAAPPVSGLWSQVAEERLARAVRRHRVHVAAGVHRCYLANGPPRTGKTSFAVGLARAFGGRLLNLDASSLPRISVRELGFLLDALGPQFLVIDDFDLAPAEGAGARLRFLLAHLKATRPSTTLVLTVNDHTKVDAALLQSGRIDEAIDFELPGEGERRELLEKLLRHHGVALDAGALVVSTAGYSHAALADLVQRLRNEPLDEVLTSTRRLRELAAEAMAAESKPASPKDAPPS